MIYITLSDKGLSVNGHAARLEGAPPGHNIICAGVSALTETLIDGLNYVARADITVEQWEGHVKICWEKLNRIAFALVETYLLGIDGIRRSYGEIEINENGNIAIIQRF